MFVMCCSTSHACNKRPGPSGSSLLGLFVIAVFLSVVEAAAPINDEKPTGQFVRPSFSRLDPVMKELRMPSSSFHTIKDGVHRGNFKYEHANGKSVRLQYEAEHAKEGVHSVDEDESVLHVECYPEDNLPMRIHLTTSEQAIKHASKWATGVYLVGGPEWQCQHNKQGQRRHFMRRVVKAVSKQNVVHLLTEFAGYEEVFKNLDLKFFTSASRADWQQTEKSRAKVYQEPGAPENVGIDRDYQPHVKPGRRLLFFDILGDATSWVASKVVSLVTSSASTISTVAVDAWHGAEAVYDVVQVLATGDFDHPENTDTWDFVSWNFDPSTGSAVTSDVPINTSNQHVTAKCLDCYFHVSASLQFELNIQDYSLQSALLNASAEESFRIQSLTVGVDYDFHGETKIFEPDPLSITVVIAGIPFFLHFHVPVYMGYNISLGASVEVGNGSAIAYSQGSVGFGIQYTSGNWRPIHSEEHTITGDFAHIHWSTKLVAQVWLRPVLIVDVDYIGGPMLSVKPFLEFVADYENPQPCTDNNEEGLQLSLNWGLQLSFGFKVEIQFAGHSIVGPWSQQASPFLSTKKLIASTCRTWDAQGNQVNNNNAVTIGSSWQCDDVNFYMTFDSDGIEVCALPSEFNIPPFQTSARDWLHYTPGGWWYKWTLQWLGEDTFQSSWSAPYLTRNYWEDGTQVYCACQSHALYSLAEADGSFSLSVEPSTIEETCSYPCDQTSLSDISSVNMIWSSDYSSFHFVHQDECAVRTFYRTA